MNIWTHRKYLMKQSYLMKKYFFSELNKEGITDEDYAYAQNVGKNLT